jgi:hypothetical protein
MTDPIKRSLLPQVTVPVPPPVASIVPAIPVVTPTVVDPALRHPTLDGATGSALRRIQTIGADGSRTLGFDPPKGTQLTDLKQVAQSHADYVACRQKALLLRQAIARIDRELEN